ncbi:hypothetical protein CV103_10025 [Sphingomonas fennica]|uniref:OpgC domain-containing protein n=2 Tax=Edaphosphingomonas fennica TaxID=114404 RepID=A0A2T4I0A2_9SPHN|nr:hypothetical protein CV103_10025 [Sphingomonas fennica]
MRCSPGRCGRSIERDEAPINAFGGSRRRPLKDPGNAGGRAVACPEETIVMERDQRIDILRGIAIVTILLNHISIPLRTLFHYHGPTIPTLTQYGYSSAASLFVAMSGYMVGMVYLKRPSPMKAAVKRAGELYVINLIVLAVIVPLAYAAPPALDSYWKLRPMIEPPFAALIRFLTLLDAPAFLDVLQLYVALLLLTPVAILLLRRSPLLLAGCSILLWAAMQVAGVVFTPDTVLLSNGHSLNVLAWQLTFFLPLIAGALRLHHRIFAWFEARPAATAWIWGALAVSALARIVAAERVLPLTYELVNRPLNSPVWLFHSVLVLAGYIGLLTWLRGHLQLWPFQLLASLGRNSLNVFAASIPLIYVLSWGFGSLDWGFAGYLLAFATLLGLSLAIAAWGDRRKHRKKARPPVAASQAA